jgi:hypothetical protein
MALKHDLVAAIPSLRKKYLKYESYKGQRVTDIFTPEQLKDVVVSNAYRLESSVLMNNRKGGFDISALPAPAQFSPVYGIAVEDFDKDGKADILLGGNFYESKPEVGIYDASYGLLLKGDGHGRFCEVAPQKTGLIIRGGIRDMLVLRAAGRKMVLIGLNNDQLRIIE